MLDTTHDLDISKALLDPASIFAEPADILRNGDLAPRIKLRLLEQWEREARALHVADDEGMTGGEESMLARVRRAITELGAAEIADQSGTGTKHG
jgi:hypothetical protein